MINNITLKNMFIYLCCSLTCFMKMFHRRDDKTNSEHNPTQSREYSCNDLPFPISFDIFHLICFYTRNYFFPFNSSVNESSCLIDVVQLQHLPKSHRLWNTGSLQWAVTLGWPSIDAHPPAEAMYIATGFMTLAHS